jgi:hypothetical protein
MKTTLLLPNRFKKLGWILFVPMLAIGIFVIVTDYQVPWLQAEVFALTSGSFFDKKLQNGMFIETNLTNTVLGVLFIIGAILVSFSKEKNEDEFIAIIRLKSLLWAVLVNYMLLIIAFLLVYELPFFTVMTFNMFTVLLLFIFRFHFLLYRSKSAMANEK